jgi:hypothetical protein
MNTLDWQDINTAPRDGCIILGWNANTELPEVVVWDKRDYWVSARYYKCMNSAGDPVGYDLDITMWVDVPTVQ